MERKVTIELPEVVARYWADRDTGLLMTGGERCVAVACRAAVDANPQPADPPDNAPALVDINQMDGPKMLRETACVAQTAIGQFYGPDGHRVREHIDRLQRLADACDVHRPLGADGSHGDLHTPTCGCVDKGPVVPPQPPADPPMTGRPWIYVAGPYTNPDPVTNTRAAVHAAEELAKLGWLPIVPHLSHLWHLIEPHDIEFWYAYDLALLAKCDWIVRLEGASTGADAEVEFAQRTIGIPVWIMADYGRFPKPPPVSGLGETGEQP